MAEFGVQNLASFALCHAKFQLDRLTAACGCGLAIGQRNETEKFDRIRPFDLEILP